MTEKESVFVCMLVSENKIQVYDMLEFLVKSKEIHTSKMAHLLVACVTAIVKLRKSIVSKTVNSFMYYGHFMI